MAKNFTAQIIFSLIIFLNINITLFGQTQEVNQFTVRIESGEGENLQSCNGYLFITRLTKQKILLKAILASKNVINNTGEIKVFFNTKSGEEQNKTNSSVVTVSIKPYQTIQDNNNNLVIIPLSPLFRSVENKELVFNQVHLTDDALLELNPEIKGSDFKNLISRWDWEVTELLKE